MLVHPITVQRRLAKGWTRDAAEHTPDQNVATNLTGQRFGRLLVLERAGHKEISSGRKFVQWKCLCDCGIECIITADNMRAGNTKSCGCFRVDDAKARFTRHGAATRQKPISEFRIWQAMHDRCRREKSTVFRHYGGRGIAVCARWLTFENFYADMGPRPKGHSLDRRDNDGDYEPHNCRWATKLEQMRNTRANRLRGIGNEHISWAQAADYLAMPPWTLRRYLLAVTNH